jgi:hypothetical protein
MNRIGSSPLDEGFLLIEFKPGIKKFGPRYVGDYPLARQLYGKVIGGVNFSECQYDDALKSASEYGYGFQITVSK